MTTNQAHAITAICTALVIGAILLIAYYSFYTPPTPPPIDPRKTELLEVVKDSLTAANTLKPTHTATVMQAEEMPKVKRATAKKWNEVAKVRISRSDSLQGVVLINRLNK
jgi:hypothetical protein